MPSKSGLLQVMRSIAEHPLNAGHRFESLGRFAKWQIGSRLVPGPVLVPFINDAKLAIRRGQIGATGNIYTGLLDFEEMALLLHFIRPTDTFADVGANVGVYTVLAGAAGGASCISMEPLPATFADLMVNIRINGMESRCRAENVAIGSAPGTLRLTIGLGAMNYVVPAGTEDAEGSVEVPVRTLDEILVDASPAALKVDVEGFEKEVIAGADRTLANPLLRLVIMEVNECANRYGYDGSVIYATMAGYGFETYRYLPRERLLVKSNTSAGFNVVFIRGADFIQERLKAAPEFEIRQIGATI